MVGGGYSGLFTALTVARGGRSVTLIEAGHVGNFASTRNFGAIGRTIRVKFSDLVRRDGLETAIRVYEEASAWADFTASFIERERIDCRFRRGGRVVGAHCPSAYDAMVADLEEMSRHLPVETEMVPRSEQHLELGSDVYHGCAVLRDVGHLDPGRYLNGVVERVLAEDVQIAPQTRVTGVERHGEVFKVITSRGTMTARDVVLTTNAETGTDNALFRHFHRRVVPVHLYSVVTERLDDALFDSVVPTRRTVLESRRLYMGLRPIEGENRLLVVSRHMTHYRDEESAAAAIKLDLLVRYPQLADVSFTHCWSGRFAITFDWLPHIGTHDGVHYLIGLNGAGVPAAGYLGQKLGLRLLGQSNSETVFADRPYPTRLGYTGQTWFLPALAAYYRYADRREAGLSR